MNNYKILLPLQILLKAAALIVLATALPASANWNLVESFTGGNVTNLTKDPAGNIYALVDGDDPTLVSTAVFKSTDNGQTWSRIQIDSDSIFIRIVKLVADSQGNLYANAAKALISSHSDVPDDDDYGIYKSTNAGVTWAAISTEGNLLHVDRSDNLFAYLSQGSGPGVKKSNDGGVTWTDTNGIAPVGDPFLGGLLSHPRSASALCADNGAAIICIGRNEGDLGYYRSDDGGLNWAEQTVDFGLRNVNELVAEGDNFYLSYSSGGPIFLNGALQAPHGVYKSSDDGITWSAASNGLPFYDPELSDLQLGYGLTAGGTDELFVSVRDSAAFSDQSNGLKKIFTSTDGGDNWSEVYSSLFRIQAVLSSDTTLLVGTHKRGIFRSTDNGTTWGRSNTGLNALHVRTLHARDNGDLVAGTSADVSVSYDNGGTWNTDTIADSNNQYWQVNDLLEDNAGNLYAATDGSVDAGGELFKSTNGGMSWALSSGGLSQAQTALSARALGISPDGSTLYLGANGSSVVYKSTDSGGSWTPTAEHRMNVNVITHSSDMVIADNGDVFTNRDRFVKSSDGGTSWQYVDDARDSFHALFKGRSGTLYAFDSVSLRKSVDNAVTFGPAIDVFQDGGDALALLDLGGGELYVALNGGLTPEAAGVYRSTNNGDHWTNTSLGLPDHQVLSLALGGDGNIYAGTDGAGLFRLTPGEGVIADNGCVAGWCMSVVGYTSGDGITSIPVTSRTVLNLTDSVVPTDATSGNILVDMNEAYSGNLGSFSNFVYTIFSSDNSHVAARVTFDFQFTGVTAAQSYDLTYTYRNSDHTEPDGTDGGNNISTSSGGGALQLSSVLTLLLYILVTLVSRRYNSLPSTCAC